MASMELSRHSIDTRNTFNNREILIIEDSTQSSFKINNLLKKMGFRNIYTSHTAASGLYEFEELTKSGKTPLIFLNFFPDTDILSIVKIIHQIDLETRIILFSEYDPNDEKVLKMISDGVYRSIKTPISQKDINELMNSITADESYMEAEPFMELKLEKLLTQKSLITPEDIRGCGVNSQEEVFKILHDLKLNGFIVEKNESTQICCNKCSSIQILSSYNCVSCKKSKFQKCVLIEHYACGNISTEQTYDYDQCPACKKEIKAIGVDYRILNNFICLECNDKFPEPLMINQCMKCKNNFEMSDAMWKVSKSFIVI